MPFQQSIAKQIITLNASLQLTYCVKIYLYGNENYHLNC